MKTKKPVIKFEVCANLYDYTDPKHHFFVSSMARWEVGYDVGELISRMKSEGYPFNVYMVEGHVDRDYQIRNYAPDCEGVTFLGFYYLGER